MTWTTSWYGSAGAPTRKSVFSRRVAKISRSRSVRPASATGSLLIAIRWSAVISTTICGFGEGSSVGPCVSAGRSMSVPFCVIGNAAMKITRRTSRTSISGVTFMSARLRGVDGARTASAPRCFRVT
jgi:hypothetical protein